MIVSGSANPLLLGQSTGYNLTRSLRFRSSASAYLNRTNASTTNQKTFTFSFWVKRGLLSSFQYLYGAGNGSNDSTLAFYSDDTFAFFLDDGTSATGLRTTQVFRDPASEYHFVVALDTTQATASNRMKFYVNGAQITAFGTANYPSQNSNWQINSTSPMTIGRARGGSYFDGYLSEFNFIDGQALTPSSFGSTNALTGVWQPARYTGTYGTNGFYLPFTDNSALTTSSNVGLGKDFSGNGNYWTTNNISITSGTTYDSMTDVPTLTSATVANYCVLNPLVTPASTTLINGNLGMSGYAAYSSATGTLGVSSGKWYFEFVAQSNAMSGITGTPNGSYYPGQASNAYAWDSANTTKYSNNTGASYGSATSAGDIVGVAFDLDGGSITFYKNNVSQGTAYTFTPSGFYFPVVRNGSATNTSVNFGQQPFTYTPPTGYVALNTYNLPTPTILAGNKYMDATLYTGNGTNQTITNAGGFKPDLVWVKCRSLGYGNYLEDSVRGVGKDLSSNSTAAEATYNLLTSFNSNGFTVSTSSGTYLASNDNGQTFVGWQWQAGQGTTSSNTSGTITSTVSVNASAGFSIVVYTGNGTNGATVGHGLGVKPSLIIEKGRSTTYNWPVQGCGVLWPTATQTLFLNGTGALNAGSGVAAPTSSVFTPSATLYANESGVSNIAYCFAPIAGYSAFGTFVGNGTSDNSFVYTGFRPKFVMIKPTSGAGGDWIVQDTARNPYNVATALLNPDLSDAEYTTSVIQIDFLSNGFKVRGSWAGYTLNPIYAAFAENPTKYALAR